MGVGGGFRVHGRGGQGKPWWGHVISDLVVTHCPCAPTGHLAADPQRGSAVAGGVERSPGQQPLRCEESIPCLDIRTVCQRPLGAVPVQFPAAGELAQALPHSPQLRLALRFHAAAVRHASGGPQVRTCVCASVPLLSLFALLCFLVVWDSGILYNPLQFLNCLIQNS